MKGENEMDTKITAIYNAVGYVKATFNKKLIDENEYLLIQKRLMKDYGVVSNITA